MADNAQQARARAALRERADQVSTRIPAPGEKAPPRAATPAPAPRTAPAPAPRPAPRPSGGSAGRTGRPRDNSFKVRAPRHINQGETHNYQGIILAEFVLAELLVAATPIAVRKNQPGLSPYVPRDMTKLVAIGLVYFLLELLAVGGRSAGRFGAWFGAIILLGVGLNEANNVVHVLDLLAGVKDKVVGTVSKGNAAPDTLT